MGWVFPQGRWCLMELVKRLEVVGGDLSVLPGDRDGTDEVTEILSQWLRYSDAIRWSIADWQLSTLLRCAVEHHGWSDR